MIDDNKKTNKTKSKLKNVRKEPAVIDLTNTQPNNSNRGI